MCVGTPNCAERTGTWINVDGVPRAIAAARPAPAGVRPLAETIRELTARVQPAEVDA